MVTEIPIELQSHDQHQYSPTQRVNRANAMSSSPTRSRLNSDPEMWPILTDVGLKRARPYGRVRQADLGEILYRPGEVGRPCFVLLSATLEIVQPSVNGELLITHLIPGMFTVSLLHRALAEF
jgi:hypothetical protein